MKRRDRIAILLAGAATAAVPALVMAEEKTAYRYDARGRLVEVRRKVDSASNVVTNYAYDRADNRYLKQTAGSPNPPPP